MGLDKIWDDEASRAVEILGGNPLKYKRKVDDRLEITFTLEEWTKLFNVDPSYTPCSADGTPYRITQPLVIHFIRKVEDERT